MVATCTAPRISDRFFVGENFERFATDKYNDRRPIWFYVPILLAGLAPWSPFVFLGIPTIRRVLKLRAPGGRCGMARGVVGGRAVHVLHAVDR